MTAATRVATIVFAFVLALAALMRAVDWAVEYLWLSALDLTAVFWTVRSLKAGLFAAVFAVAFALFWINLRLLVRNIDWTAVQQRLAPHALRPGARPQGVAPALAGPLRRPERAAVPLALAWAAVFGLVGYARWDDLLRFLHAQPFGAADPVFGRDVGFFVFRLPFLDFLQNTATGAALIAVAATVGGYLAAGALKIDWRKGMQGSDAVLTHIAASVALLLVTLAAGFYLDRYELLLSDRGVVAGAGYTDVAVMLPALWVAIGASLALAAAVMVPAVVRRTGLTLTTLGGYLGVLAVSLAVAPWSVQAFKVEPSELELETPYLRHNIEFTRRAFGIDRVEERTYDAGALDDPAVIERNRDVLENVRLWDWRIILQTFRQLQQIRTYYDFKNVDVDRYTIDGAVCQVMVSARELSGRLPDKAETWVNRHLQYTHGYGLAISLAALKSPEGLPAFMVKDIPPDGAADLAVTRPEIYFGEDMWGYRLVNTEVPELNHPRGDENVYVRYGGSGGVPLDALWKRLLFALHALDVRIALTTYAGPESRIQIWRNVAERIERAAPFLVLDRDPYLVLSEGRLFWIQDAYTRSESYPYAEPAADGTRYIRNSVKVVVDAYEGALAFYVVDAADPLLAAYRAALPGMFRPLAAMPEGLRRHLRYPQDLFEMQVEKFATYHMTTPQVFYNAEDVWAIPHEMRGALPMSLRGIHEMGQEFGGPTPVMKPYYVMMKLAGEDRLQFLLITPLVPANRDNMIAWMAARSDEPDYSRLVVYKLPKDRVVLGPAQVQATIDQDTEISRQIALWDQKGSRVLRGQLLAVPIENSFLYLK